MDYSVKLHRDGKWELKGAPPGERLANLVIRIPGGFMDAGERPGCFIATPAVALVSLVRAPGTAAMVFDVPVELPGMNEA